MTVKNTKPVARNSSAATKRSVPSSKTPVCIEVADGEIAAALIKIKQNMEQFSDCDETLRFIYFVTKQGEDSVSPQEVQEAVYRSGLRIQDDSISDGKEIYPSKLSDPKTQIIKGITDKTEESMKLTRNMQILVTNLADMLERKVHGPVDKEDPVNYIERPYPLGINSIIEEINDNLNDIQTRIDKLYETMYQRL